MRVDLLFITHLLAHRRLLNIHGTVGLTAPAHQAVVHHLRLQTVVTKVAQKIYRLYILNIQIIIQRTSIYADAATRAGTQFEFGITRRLLMLLHSQLAEIDEEHLCEDVHVTRERHRHKESAQGDGIERPQRQLESRRHRLAEKIANGLRHKASVMVKGCGRTFR